MLSKGFGADHAPVQFYRNLFTVLEADLGGWKCQFRFMYSLYELPCVAFPRDCVNVSPLPPPPPLWHAVSASAALCLPVYVDFDLKRAFSGLNNEVLPSRLRNVTSALCLGHGYRSSGHNSGKFCHVTLNLHLRFRELNTKEIHSSRI
jgi:hypothetical protein